MLRKRIEVRLTEAQHDWLAELAQQRGVSASQAIRLMIEDEIRAQKALRMSVGNCERGEMG
jgi:post-segregation antitoxin (ccd killing protein)